MTLSVDERDRLCGEAISSYLFDKVWNEAVSEYRTNVHPLLLKSKSFVSTLRLNGSTISLPESSTPYIVWMIDTDTLNIKPECENDVWYSLAEINNKYRVMIDFYGVNGSMFSKAATYIRYINDGESALVVARKHMVQKMLPMVQWNEVFATFYYDSDIPNDRTVLSIQADSDRRLDIYANEIHGFLSRVTRPETVTIYKNGFEFAEYPRLPSINAGDYIDIVIDDNIVFAFDVDVTNTSQDPVYLSQQDHIWKQLIHIPIAFNPQNKIYTHNTCDFYVREYGSIKGLYLHRVHNCAVTQVTHNDFGIALDVLDAYRDYLQSQLLTIHVVVREHDKDNVLVRDACYLDLLYSDKHDDEDIIKFLTGKNEKAQIEWWTAPVTEASAYVHMFFDTPNGDLAHHPREVMQTYVDALGIIPIVGQICKSLRRVKVTDAWSGVLNISLPVLFPTDNVEVILSLNGLLVLPKYYKVTTDDEGHATITVSPDLVVTEGDEFTCQLIPGADNTVQVETVTPDENTFNLPYPPDIYEKKISIDDDGNEIVSWGKLERGTNTYILLPKEDGTYDLTFNREFIGTSFMMQNPEAFYTLNIDVTEAFAKTGDSIAIALMSEDEQGKSVPLLSVVTEAVYLNRHYLVEGLDYYKEKAVDAAGNLIGYNLYIQTMDYFDETTKQDILTIYLFNNIVEDKSNGFETNNELYDATPINTYYPQISTVYVAGQIEMDAVYQGIRTLIPDGVYEQGSTWEIKTAIPRVVKDFVEDYATDEHLEREETMNEYFYKLNDPLPDPLVLKDSHRIYSISMNNFINDYLNGKIAVAAEPDAARMDAMYAPYLKQQAHDLVYTGIDQQFVDFYPQYTTRAVTVEQRKIIEKFINAYMPQNKNATDAVVYGE